MEICAFIEKCQYFHYIKYYHDLSAQGKPWEIKKFFDLEDLKWEVPNAKSKALGTSQLNAQKFN